jgi:hypothetical protein
MSPETGTSPSAASSVVIHRGGPRASEPAGAIGGHWRAVRTLRVWSPPTTPTLPSRPLLLDDRPSLLSWSESDFRSAEMPSASPRPISGSERAGGDGWRRRAFVRSLRAPRTRPQGRRARIHAGVARRHRLAGTEASRPGDGWGAASSSGSERPEHRSSCCCLVAGSEDGPQSSDGPRSGGSGPSCRTHYLPDRRTPVVRHGPQ